MTTKGFDGKPPWRNPDPPHVQAQVAIGLKNLFAWLGICPRGYAGPWPSPYQLQDDQAYAMWLEREDVVAALRSHAPAPKREARPVRCDEPPVPSAAPDGPEYDNEPEEAFA